MLDKTTDVRVRLEQARSEFAKVETELANLETRKNDASKTRDAFEQWRAHYAAAISEKERLPIVIELLENEFARSETQRVEDEWRERYAALEASIPELAKRIRDDIAKANSIYSCLIRDVVKSNLELQAVNANRPEGLDQLASADFLARGLPSLSREELKRERIWLWVANSNGHVIGDQDQVRDLGDGKGIIENNITKAVRCSAALFDKITFHAPLPAQRPDPLWSIRLVQPDGPGHSFDGEGLSDGRQVLVEMDKRDPAKVDRRSRQVHAELVPIQMVDVE
jgi:hypothetical protein